MKVFELAKELDTKALDLIEKIKPLNLSIKNHMSELSDDQIVRIKEFYILGSEGASDAPKPTVVKRKKASAVATKKKAVVIKRKKDVEEEKEAELNLKEDIAEETLPLEASSEEEAVAQAPEELLAETEVSTPLEEPTLVADAPLETSAPEEVVEAAGDKEVPKQKARRFSFIRVAEANTDEAAVRRPVIIEDVVSEEVKKEYQDVKARKLDEDDEHVSVERSAADILRELEKDEAQGKKKGNFSFRDTAQVTDFRSTDYLRRERVYPVNKRRRISFGKAPSKISTVAPGARKRVVDYRGNMSVEALAEEMSVKVRQVAMKLDALGIERPDAAAYFDDWILDFETVQLIAAEFGYEARDRSLKEESLVDFEEEFELLPRPPVVTIMGHVDHGKTSLLDFLRRSKVVDREAGGITQHIGAYTIKVQDAVKNIEAGLVTGSEVTSKAAAKKGDKKSDKVKKSAVKADEKESKSSTKIPEITFLDTPGHAAFSSMRARGAQVTDIVVLVVAATEGLMPQSKEAIDHAKAADVPVIVAVNKMDLPEANPDKVLQQLSEMGVLTEDWGGDVLVAKISAKTGLGVADLLEKIQLQSEILELQARKEGPAFGSIIEARLDKGRGSVATTLINEGTLKVGDYVVVGMQAAKVRALIDDQGKNIKEAGPSMPVMILGLNAVPEAGDPLNVVEDEKKAKDLIDLRKRQSAARTGNKKMTLEEMMRMMNEGETKELPIVLKADVKGSIEAIQGSLLKIPSNKVKLKVVSSAVGGVSESDVVLASASKAIVIAFNVRPDAKTLAAAERLGVEIKTYNIIYNLLDDIVKTMEGLLAPNLNEEIMGQAEVRNVFNLSRSGVVAGSFVVSGKILRSSHVRVLRQGRIVFTGVISGLKRFKDDAKEVAQGYECGISVENFNDIKEGDILECFKQVESAAKLSDGAPSNSSSASQ